ncbi:MAG: M20/M25/M40 family metallo-hydrolase, partial [Bacteroidia bacterium]
MENQAPLLNKSDTLQMLSSFLSGLISIPSISKEEAQSAEFIENYLKQHDIESQRIKNNIIVKNQFFDETKPSILLNSHHDTVKPNNGYSVPPFQATLLHDKLIGLGSNDAGAALTCLIHVFIHYYKKENLNYNLILVASAEEEISGKDGIECVLPELQPIDFAIVGEPTSMQMAIAQKGLLVVDCVAKGKSGHAARNEGINAID